MGDAQRFRLFSGAIAENFPDRNASIADVAGGRCQLNTALHLIGYRNVISWDKRKKNANSRGRYHYGLFDYRSAPRNYDLVVGMHPDEGTDHIVQYACKHKKPFMVCPCCVKPSASRFEDIGYEGWIRHLVRLAEVGRLAVEIAELPMRGRNLIIVGRPKPKEAADA
jgi:hypothetical protein